MNSFEKGTAKTGEITCTDSISGTDGDPSETCKLKATSEVCTDKTCNNKTYTHPAFTFGEEEIEGFLIGKFELTGTISDITTKPDLSSFETNIMNMKNSSNSYGFNTSTDTHMIKNMEWGAVAYLSNYFGYVYNDRLADFVFAASGVSYPDDKYYDKYSYSTSDTSRKRSI